jgi:predicted nucleotidyltransferase
MSNTITELQIQNEVEKHISLPFDFLYLLGSAGTERFTASSDIDLAVYWKTPPDFKTLVSISAALENHFQREVDLVSLNIADLIFSRQVLETGRLLICRSPGIHLQWKAEQLSRYPDFKYSRKIIEEKILNRKKYV